MPGLPTVKLLFSSLSLISILWEVNFCELQIHFFSFLLTDFNIHSCFSSELVVTVVLTS